MNWREIAVNALLGVLLVLIFAIPFALGIFALGFVFSAVDLTIKHFLPGFGRHSDLAFYGFVCIWSLISGIGHLRKRLWSSAFLCFAVIPATVSFVLAASGSAFGDDKLFVMIWILIILLTSRSRPTRLEFMESALVIAASFAINTGLLGSETVARLAMYCVILAIMGLFGGKVRREQWLHDRAEVPSLTRA
jgi:hypothetical protein